MGRYLPAETQLTELPMPTQDVVLQLFSHRSVEVPIGVPAVVEPLLVLVLAGAAQVEERTPGGQWNTVNVRAGDFFLTDTDEPYEMRWQALEGERFEVMHLYLGLPLIDQAARELLGPQSTGVALLDVSGARDETVRWLMDQLRRELLDRPQASPLYVRGLAQALAVHLLRHYRDFSRMFKRATGLSPSQYFIGLRMARARQLLLETPRSIIDIGLEVGYSSPSHFSQVFRREVGVTPSTYRQG